eukprot:s4_g20.t1
MRPLVTQVIARDCGSSDSLEALLNFQHREEVEALAHASLDFLKGPRRFRQKPGRVGAEAPESHHRTLQGTDHRADDLVMDEIVRLRREALDFGASLCRKATAARAWTAEDTAERSELRRTRQEAAETIEDSKLYG